MAGVPYIFGNATTSIPLSQLDQNFNTTATLGNAAIGLGNVTTTVGNLTLTNVNIVSGTVPAPTSIANGTSNVSISSSGGNINVVTGGIIATFPAVTGTVMVSGNMPAFSAYMSSAQTLTQATITKLQLNTKEFDTNNCYDATTNYRFTPTVAGYYQCNGEIDIYSQGNTITGTTSYLYKNGSQIKRGTSVNSSVTSTINESYIAFSALVYLNGSTDYIEFYVYASSAGGTLTANGGAPAFGYFQASLVRTA